MSRYYSLFLYSLASLFAFLFSISPLRHLYPQFVAFFAIITFVYSLKYQKIPMFAVIFIINLLVFTTGGVNSPVFFLVYFLLLVIAFQNAPLITLLFSTFSIILLSQSLNSFVSIIPLFSLILIAPLAWFIGQQQLENYFLQDTVSQDETDIYLWLSLKFKKSLSQIIDSTSLLLSDPKLSHSQKSESQKIKNISQDLLVSASNLTQKVSDNDKTNT